MKILLSQSKRTLIHILPTLVIITVLVAAGTLVYAFTPKPENSHSQKNSPKKITVEVKKQLPVLTVTPIAEKVWGTKTKQTGILHSVTSISHNTATAQPTNSTSNTSSTQQQTAGTSSSTNLQASTQTFQPTVTPQPTVVSLVSPTTAPVNATVALQIQDPTGTASFTVTLKDGANVCDVLQEAKNEGKINSVTFDDSYLATLHSRYVTEINGYTNNWTFTVNGSLPAGCSLINPKPNDHIIWKFS